MVQADTEPLKGEASRQHWELMLLRLIRQLPRGNPHRELAEQFMFDHGTPNMDLRRVNEILADTLTANVCGTCGGSKMHTRLKGYRCPTCD